MYKKILIATDGTEQGSSAVIEAINMAVKFNSQIFLLHVLKLIVDSDPYGMSGLTLEQRIQDSTKKYMTVFQNLAQSDGVLKFETLVRHGINYPMAIIDEAKKNEIDLIMLGRRSSDKVKRFLFGSITSQIIQQAPCSVLIVPLTSLIEWKNILLAVTTGPEMDRTVEDTIKIARENNSKIYLLRDWKADKTESAVQNIKKKLDSENIENELVSAASGNPEVINALVMEKNIDVIVFPHIKRSIFNVFRSDPLDRIIDNSICSILMVKK